MPLRRIESEREIEDFLSLVDDVSQRRQEVLRSLEFA